MSPSIFEDGCAIGEGLDRVDRPLRLGLAKLRARQEHVAHVVRVPAALGEVELVLRGRPRSDDGAVHRVVAHRVAGAADPEPEQHAGHDRDHPVEPLRHDEDALHRPGRPDRARHRAVVKGIELRQDVRIVLGDGAGELLPHRSECRVRFLGLLGARGVDDHPRAVSHAQRETRLGRRDALDGLGVAHGPHVQYRAARVDDAPGEQIGTGAPGQ